jgi:hypothetical protein
MKVLADTISVPTFSAIAGERPAERVTNSSVTRKFNQIEKFTGSERTDFVDEFRR